MRGDIDWPIVVFDNSSFNPRPYMRGDVLGFTHVFHGNSFNPRPYMRGDFAVEDRHTVFEVSIHAPT